MKSCSIPACVAAAGLAAAVSGQTITTPGVSATFSMDWIEDPAFAHNDNGILEPGEHALIRMSLSFTNQYQYVNFSPAIGPFTRGIAVGLGSAFIDIRSASANPFGVYNNGVTIPPSTSVGPDSNPAGTMGYGIRAIYRVAGDTSNGTPVANGFSNIQPGQYNSKAISPLTDNPITNLDRLGWTPISYAARTVNFAVVPAVGSQNYVLGLYLDLDGTTDGTQAGYVQGNTSAAAYVPVSHITFGSVNIPIAPAPAGLGLLGLGGLIVTRRKRAFGGWDASR